MPDRDRLMMPHAPVTMDDLVDASRLILYLVQADSYVAWRDNRWYDDDLLRTRIKEDRHAWRFRASRRMFRDRVFDLPIAQDIILAGLPYTPLQAISSLDQLGLDSEASPAEDYEFALSLLDRPELFDPVRETGVPLSEVHVTAKVLGADRFRLMWQAGMSSGEILSAVYSGVLPDMDMLGTLVALRATSPKT